MSCDIMYVVEAYNDSGNAVSCCCRTFVVIACAFWLRCNRVVHEEERYYMQLCLYMNSGMKV